MGEYEKAQEYYKEGIKTAESVRILPSVINMDKVSLARAKVLDNNRDINLGELFEYYENNKLNVLKGWMARSIGEILLNIDGHHITEAEEWIKKSIESDKKNDTMWLLGCDYALYAELFKRKGDKSKARENLDEAIKIFKECGADGWLEKVEKELAAIS